MKRLAAQAILLVALFVPALASAQPLKTGNATVTYSPIDPTGGCSNYRLWWNTTDNTLWICESGAWLAASSVGGGAWGGITGSLPTQADLQAALDSKINDPGGGNGVLARTGTGTVVARTITAGDGQSCVNGNGVAGNPTCSVDASVGRKGSGAGAPPGDCGNTGDAYQVGDTYMNTLTTTLNVCEAPDQWVPINRGRGGILHIDDFLTGSITTPNIGEMGWSLGVIGGGITTVSSGTSTDNHPGVLNLQESTLNDGGVFTGSRMSLSSADFAGKDWGFEFELQSVTAVTTVGMWVGLMSGASPLSTAGAVHAVYNTAVGHATWQCSMCDSATTGCQSAGDDTNQKTTVSTQTPSAASYDRIAIWHRNNGVGGISTFYCAVNGETPRTWCASDCDETASELPAAVMFPYVAVQDQVSGARNFNLDWARFWVTGLAR